MIKQENCTIVSQREIIKSIFELTLAGDIVKEMNEAGQFVHLKVSNSSDPLLRRPISICSIDKENKQFTIIYRADGYGTELLSMKRSGETVDVLGPLGNGFPTNEVNSGETALIVGGGVGTPPLYELSKQLVSKGVKVIHLLGYESKVNVFYEEEFSKLGDVHITTVDGSYGNKGFVTDILHKLPPSFAAIYSCGPSLMLKALQEQFAGENLFISLEERMACGIGACFACVCETSAEDKAAYKKICSDGPVFRAEEVVIK